jgi:hypothetical protein
MIVRRCSSLLLASALLAAPLAAAAQMQMPMPRGAPSPTAAPSPSASEAAFLKQIMTQLPRLYPTTAAANAAGYVRYTNEDRTGAISYVNPAYWDSNDVNHPSQLWYDVNGRLIGADYSMLQKDAPNGPTALHGIAPSRFHRVGAHVHYVTCASGGAQCTYGRAVGAARYAAANGGDFSHPPAEGLVRAGAVTNTADVKNVILFPAAYDVSIWVVPNPLGQFADANPNVHPSANAGPGESSG